MTYPISIKEYFDPDGGINTILVKKDRPRPNVPPPPNPCMGATDSVDLKVSYRGSDWGEGISSAIEVNGEIWNIDHGERLLGRWGDVEFSVGGYNFVTTFEGRDGRATLSVKPHHNTDYVIVKIIPDSGDMEGNRLLGVIGGGQIKYDPYTTVAEFCLKPTLKPPISCFGAQDRITFRTQPFIEASRMMARVSDSSELSELIYNVTVDGVDYGVIKFHETPNPTFGKIGLTLVSEPSADLGVYSLMLTGGIIGQGHRFNLQSVASLGGNNIHEIFRVLEVNDDGETEDLTVDYNEDTRDVEFCLAAMGRCDGASDYLGFLHYDRETEDEPGRNQQLPLMYNVTLNGVDYGPINFIDEVDSEDNNTRTFGEYQIQYISQSWGGGGLALVGGPVNIPAHIKLDPINSTASNINQPDYNRTVIYNPITKAIEFCLVRGECSGATRHIVLFANPSEDSGEVSYTQFYHSIELDDYVFNADNSIDLLRQGYISTEDGEIELTVFSDGTSQTISIGLQSNRKHGIRKVTIKPPNDGENFVTGINTNENPTTIEHPGGVITGCIDIWQPQ